MESAIPAHLRRPRSRPTRCPHDYRPPVPAWTARGDIAIDRVVVGYHGVQWRPEHEAAAAAALRVIEAQVGSSAGIGAVHRARYVDPQGYTNQVVIGHWADPDDYERFATGSDVAAWWASAEREAADIGVFREVFLPRATHLETLFNADDHLLGIGELLGSHSQSDVQEHAYWGGMRDRLPAAQTEALEPAGAIARETGRSGARIRVIGQDNLAVIRSGQDWSATRGEERDLYLKAMRPVLEAGMEYLSRRGGEIGCLSNRLMDNVDADGAPIDRAFGLGYWRSLADLEAWAEHHPTHLAIFDGFMDMAKTLKGQFDLRLFHEVFIAQSSEQILEYIGCHPATGLLAAAAPDTAGGS